MAKDKKHGKTLDSDLANKKQQKATFVFTKDNYKWMAIAFGVIVLGFILMYGDTPDLFDEDGAQNLSFATQVKVTIAPIVVLAGYGIGLYSIMKKPKTKTNEGDSANS